MKRHSFFALLFATVWISMGLLAKVLGFVPRHQEIVARILGESHAAAITIAIGLGEIVFGIWILTRWHWRLSCLLQIGSVGVMNAIELTLAPDLLLFGPWNGLVALAYMALVAWAGFGLPDSNNSPIS